MTNGSEKPEENYDKITKFLYSFYYRYFRELQI